MHILLRILFVLSTADFVKTYIIENRPGGEAGAVNLENSK